MNLPRTLAVAITAASLLACHASAANRESAGFTNVPSDGTMQSRTMSFAGSYTVKTLLLTGNLELLATGTRASEASIEIQPPSGSPFRIQPFSGVSLGTQAAAASPTLSRWIVRLPVPVRAAGTWTFRFSETVNQTGVDARWNTLTIQLNDGPPASAIDMGTLGIGHNQNTPAAAAQVTWFRFVTNQDATAASGRYLVAAAEALTAGADGVIALYDVDGRLLRSDDDDGAGNQPLLTMGAPFPGRTLVSSEVVLDGRDGPLPAGTYYIAVATAPVVFQPGFTATVAASTPPGLFRMHINTTAASTPLPTPPPRVFRRG